MLQAAAGNSTRNRITAKIYRRWQLYLFILLPVAHMIIFSYIPMYGVTLAFKDYSIRDGILASPWVGFKYFKQFFNTPDFWLLIKNTILLSVYSLAVGFPAPILLALLLNEVRCKIFSKTVQMVTFAPYFISTVVMVGMMLQVLAPRGGFVNNIITMLGHEPINFMGEASMFRTIYVLSGVWQGMGYGSVLYIAVLSSVDENLYEAAFIDGANRIQKIIHIDIPAIAPTITLSLIMSIGGIMNVGADKVYLLQNNLNLINSEVITTYVYKVGLIRSEYSFSTAVNLFNTVINFMLLIVVNKICQKISDTSMW